MEMRCQYHSRLLALIMYVFLCSCGDSIGDNSIIDRYYPLKVGNTWNYIEKEYLGGAVLTRKITHSIIEKKRIGDSTIYISNPFGLFPIYDDRGIAKSSALIVKDKNGVGITVKIKDDMPVYPSRLYYILKAPILNGSSWRNRATIFDIFGQKFTVTDTNAEVELPDGLKFDNCLRVTSHYTSEGRRYTGEMWFAPNVGLIKSTQIQHKKDRDFLIYEIYLEKLPDFLSNPETK